MTEAEYKDAFRWLSPEEFDRWTGPREACMNLAWDVGTRTDELEDELFQRYLEYLRNPPTVFSGLTELIFTGYVDE